MAWPTVALTWWSQIRLRDQHEIRRHGQAQPVGRPLQLRLLVHGLDRRVPPNPQADRLPMVVPELAVAGHVPEGDVRRPVVNRVAAGLGQGMDRPVRA